jgi:glycosyltransferase involved in cell wall biosynthesis
VFAATGGIEKVCRVAGKAMYETGIKNGIRSMVFCMHDIQADADDNKYFPSEMFRGFGKARINFIAAALKKGRESDTVILSHINLLLVGWLIKKISPSTRIIMFAHGIEVWKKLGYRKRKMLHCCDEIISVSNYTSKKMQEIHHIPAVKCRVLNNCLDPFLPIGIETGSNAHLRARYGFKKEDTVLFTLTRLSSKERYKGYDKVLQAMVGLKKRYPGVRYLLAGSYDEKEKVYIDEIVNKLFLKEEVNMAGFIAEEDLVAHFAMADIYVMPSMKEGFGIVFIEAMYYGLPVIAGNRDGSVDALCNGSLGILVDPLDTDAIREAIEKIMVNKSEFIPDRTLLLKYFSYDQYKIKLESILMEEKKLRKRTTAAQHLNDMNG